MLSYQHIYHAGNLADVHKHALLAWMLDYLGQKPKPFSYLETHAGRAVYDLTSPAAQKTQEASAGIEKALAWFAPDHPYVRVIAAQRIEDGPQAYPGSPMIAARLMRPDDVISLAELHPGEHQALDYAMSPYPCTVFNRDGFDMAHSLVPPTPRRGLMLIDPSYEIKTDYEHLPGHISKYARAWNVGIIALWYPILTNNVQARMCAALTERFPDALRSEVRFPPARPGHGMVGSGLFVVNPPYGLDAEAARLSQCFKRIKAG